MSSQSEPRLKCPACRARQDWQDTCRRCGADLRLLVATYVHIASLEAALGAARSDGLEEREEAIQRELLLFRPSTGAARR
jgi:hypothetical protein